MGSGVGVCVNETDADFISVIERVCVVDRAFDSVEDALPELDLDSSDVKESDKDNETVVLSVRVAEKITDEEHDMDKGTDDEVLRVGVGGGVMVRDSDFDTENLSVTESVNDSERLIDSEKDEVVDSDTERSSVVDTLSD